ncbi:hypothetical protein [Brevundimonas vancanneytii]|uniref:Uncharacterized protein n=1 Tax=Brevundimonas vancanneytii TaxID=1325724 RepID=A0A4P1JTT2_9CAUL|nr:hypothetical protein [Brevundimonas vancanneytii]VTO10733.1 Uncharacterised protein [Brevundimonas vancanneytii]
MSQLPASQKPWVHFLALIGKVILLSWPIGALLLALNPLVVVVENILTSKGLWLGVPSSLISAAKLWGLFVSVMVVVSGFRFWSGIKTSRAGTKVR